MPRASNNKKTPKRKENKADELFHFDRIVGHRVSRNQLQLKIRWRGYSADDDSWEPAAGIWKTSNHSLIDYYENLQTVERTVFQKHIKQLKKREENRSRASAAATGPAPAPPAAPRSPPPRLSSSNTAQPTPALPRANPLTSVAATAPAPAVSSSLPPAQAVVSLSRADPTMPAVAQAQQPAKPSGSSSAPGLSFTALPGSVLSRGTPTMPAVAQAQQPAKPSGSSSAPGLSFTALLGSALSRGTPTMPAAPQAPIAAVPSGLSSAPVLPFTTFSCPPLSRGNPLIPTAAQESISAEPSGSAPVGSARQREAQPVRFITNNVKVPGSVRRYWVDEGDDSEPEEVPPTPAAGSSSGSRIDRDALSQWRVESFAGLNAIGEKTFVMAHKTTNEKVTLGEREAFELDSWALFSFARAHARI